MTEKDTPKQTTEWIGSASVSAKGSMNLPTPAREHLGVNGAVTLLVFGQPGRIILTPIGLADDLLEFAAGRAAEAEPDADTPESDS